MFNRISNVINKHLHSNEFDKKDQAYLRFGLQIILLLSSELLVLLFLAYILNIFWPVTIGIVTFLIIRPYAGGVHMPSFLLCMLISLLFFLSIGFIALSLSFNTISVILWLILVFISGLLMINKYAPADTEVMPIKEPQQRRLLKNKSRKILIGWLIISLLITLLLPKQLYLVFAGSLGILAEIILMHPFSFKFVQKYLPEHS